MLRRGYTRETSIRRDAKGRWYEGDTLLRHEKLTRSFAGWIDRAPDGRFCLSNDINWAYVDIEGPPYFVRGVHFDGDAVVLELSGDREAPLDPRTLRVGPDAGLWCDVRAGRVPARFTDHALHVLAKRRLHEDEEGPYFDLGSSRVRPPTVDDPMAGWDPSKGHVDSHRGG